MDASFRAIVEEVCDQLHLTGAIHVEWNSPAVEFDPQCINAVRGATEMLEYPAMEMFSGAGHDSVYVSRVAATDSVEPRSYLASQIIVTVPLQSVSPANRSTFSALVLRQARASTGSCFDRLMLRQAHASTGSA